MLETMTIPALFLGCILNLKTIKTKKVQINLPTSKTSLHQTSKIIRIKNHITTFWKKFPKSFTCWKRSRFIFRAMCAKNLKFEISVRFTPLHISNIPLGISLHIHKLKLETWALIDQRLMLMVTHLLILTSGHFWLIQHTSE